MIASFVLFFILGLGFGFALRFPFGFTALLIPLLMALGTILLKGSDGTVIARLVAALVVTAIGVMLGFVLKQFAGENARAS